MKKKKICFVITSPIHYSRNFLVIRELAKNPKVELSVLLGGSVLLSRFMSQSNNIEDFLKKDGVTNIYKMHFFLDGDEEVVKAKTTGLAVMEFADMFFYIKPDLVIVRGDRFEVLSAAVAAVYLNIKVAHIEGGDISGTIDDSVRHAITKLAHLHFVTNEFSQKRVVAMGENPNNVFNVGSPEIEVLEKVGNKKIDLDMFRQTGSGKKLDIANFVMVMFHPVYSEKDKVVDQARTLFAAVNKFDTSILWFWPNVDPGSEDLAKELRMLANQHPENKIHFSRYLPTEDYLYLLKKTRCLIGNSSAGIKECAYLGIPVVNVGTRQNGRLRYKNIADVDFDATQIATAIKSQLAAGRYDSAQHYSASNTAKQIVEIIVQEKIPLQKIFIDN